jgi:hypothetical protein
MRGNRRFPLIAPAALLSLQDVISGIVTPANVWSD